MASPSAQSTSSLLPLPDGLLPDSIDILPTFSLLLDDLKERPMHNALSLSNPISTSPAPTTSSITGKPLISIKDIPAATDSLKHKLQRARAQVKELPDIKRGIAEQEEEMRELEEKIVRQREVLRGLGEVGEGFRREREERLGLSGKGTEEG